MRVANISMLTLLLLATFGAAVSVAEQALEELERTLDEEIAPQPAPQAPAPAARPIAEPPPGYLGLYAIEVDGRLIVESVRSGSPAEAAAFRPGDQILRVGGAPLASLDEMSQVLDDLPAGTRLSFLVKRHGRDLPLLAILGARPLSSPASPRIVERGPTPAAEPASDSLAALDELERLLETAPPAVDAAPLVREPTPAADASPVLKRIATLEAKLRLLNTRISVIERTLERAEAAAID